MSKKNPSKTPLKILHVVSDVQTEASGPSYSVPSLANAQAALGEDVTLASTCSRSDQPKQRLNKHLIFYRDFARYPILKNLHFSSSLKNYLTNNMKNFDIVHVHGLWLMPNIYPSGVRRLTGPKLVLSPRGMLDPAALKYSRSKKRFAWSLYQRAAFKQFDGFHATSDQEKLDIQNLSEHDPVLVAPNGIDEISIETTKNRHKTMLYIGRIHPKKGLMSLLECWDQLSIQLKDWKLDIYGPDEAGEKERLLRFCKHRKLKNVNIHCPVYGNEKWKVYSSAHVFVMPTKGENFGINVAESLMCGTASICTDRAPWSDLDLHKAGWSVSYGTEGITQALREVIVSPVSSLIEMGQCGRQWMKSDFSWSSISEQMNQFYGRI
jgi:glycosyltransferase involved in cell wall biosynthesis